MPDLLDAATNAIYLVRHLASGRVYVGLTTKTVAVRWKQHQYDAARKGCGRGNHFHAALRKHGADAFSVEVVEAGLAEAALAEREQHWVRHFRADDRRFGFNSTSGGDVSPSLHPDVRKKIGDSQRGRALSAEHKAKVSAALKGRPLSDTQRAAFVGVNAGKTFSESHRAALRAAHLGKKASPETRQKMSDSQRIAANTAASIERRRTNARERWADPEYRDRVGAAISHAKTHSQNKRRAPTLTPELRAKYSAAAMKRWARVVEEN